MDHSNYYKIPSFFMEYRIRGGFIDPNTWRLLHHEHEYYDEAINNVFGLPTGFRSEYRFSGIMWLGEKKYFNEWNEDEVITQNMANGVDMDDGWRYYRKIVPGPVYSGSFNKLKPRPGDGVPMNVQFYVECRLYAVARRRIG